MAGKRAGGDARNGLSHRDVVDAALALIDSTGLDALTMRSLAQAIGVYPTALYWHAGNKTQLLAAVCQRVFDQIELPAVAEVAWDEWIYAMAHNTRATFHRHPNLAPYFGTHLQVGTSSFPFAEALLQVLANAGFTGEDLVDAYNTVTACVFGWISGELGREPAEDVADDWKDTFEESLHSLDDEQTPMLNRNMRLLANQAFMLRWDSGHTQPMDRSFDKAIRTLVLGLRAGLS